MDEARADEEALAIMRERARENTRWAAYQNVALDSRNCGHVQFLHVGNGCTFAEPPAQYPLDNEHGMGWRYRFIGYVDLATGLVVKGGA